VRASSRRSTAGIFLVTATSPRARGAAYLRPLFPDARHPEPPPRHCRRRMELELSARARRRPTTLIVSLGPGEAPALACLPAFHPHAAVHRAAAGTAAGRR
jgi:hypothetical protein